MIRQVHDVAEDGHCFSCRNDFCYRDRLEQAEATLRAVGETLYEDDEGVDYCRGCHRAKGSGHRFKHEDFALTCVVESLEAVLRKGSE